MLQRFSTRAEKALAQSLVDKLTTSLPPDLIENKRKILSINRVTRQLEQIYDLARQHQKEYRLGFIKRAVLANTFKWALQEKGYPQDFIDLATEGLVVELTKASK